MDSTNFRDPYGKKNITIIDRFGVYLSALAIKKHLPRNKELTIMDLGCGYDASLLVALRNKIKQGVGVDFSVNPNLNNISNLTFIESSIERAIEQNNEASPNVIMMVSVLEHLKNPEEILQKCYRLLPQGGTLLINVPTWRGKTFLEFSAFKLGLSPKIEMDDHKMYYDKRDLWPLLVSAGFKPSLINLRYHKFSLNLFAIAHKE